MMKNRIVCRICLHSKPKNELLHLCNCKSDSQPVYEHMSCILEYCHKTKDYSCSVCKQEYRVTNVISITNLVRHIFEYAYIPVTLSILIKIGLLLLVPQAISNESQGMHHFLGRLVMMSLILGSKIYDDRHLCSTTNQKKLVLYMNLMYIPCFLCLDVLHSCLHVLPLIHPGYILLLTSYNIAHLETKIFTTKLAYMK